MPVYGATVSAARVFVVLVAMTSTGAIAHGAAAADEPWPALVPATRAERQATRPLAEAVVTAYRSGRFAALCDLLPAAEVKRAHGSLRRCRQALRRVDHPCSNRCRFHLGGVYGAYKTERDKALHRKSLAWLYTMRDPSGSGRGEVEIRFHSVHGHADTADRLEDAITDFEPRVALTIEDRDALISVLEDADERLAKLRGVLLSEHRWRRAEGL